MREIGRELLSIEEPSKLEYLIRLAEKEGMKDIPIPIDFAKDVLELLRSPMSKFTFP